jgi:hypothetical protein
MASLHALIIGGQFASTTIHVKLPANPANLILIAVLSQHVNGILNPLLGWTKRGDKLKMRDGRSHGGHCNDTG